MIKPLTYCSTRACAPKNPTRRAGFSLLELLMAITVLIIIVLVLALVFQQVHASWGSGIRRSGAETTLRSVMGILERDLAHAVDGTAFGFASTFNTDFAEFITLDGTNRMPHKVKYRYNFPNPNDLTRETYSFTSASTPSNWLFSALISSAILNGNQPLSMFNITRKDPPSSTFSSDLPLRVEIEARVTKADTFALVSGWSEGRNQKPEDRIMVNP